MYKVVCTLSVGYWTECVGNDTHSPRTLQFQYPSWKIIHSNNYKKKDKRTVNRYFFGLTDWSDSKQNALPRKAFRAANRRGKEKAVSVAMYSSVTIIFSTISRGLEVLHRHVSSNSSRSFHPLPCMAGHKETDQRDTLSLCSLSVPHHIYVHVLSLS